MKFVMPKMSWERPIEQEILKFVRNMRTSMERIIIATHEEGWFSNNRLSEDAQKMADAYRIVENHILREIKIRKRLESNSK